MANNVSETLIGAVVLAVAGSFLYYATQISGFSTDTNQYSLTASFRSVSGLNVGSDVKLSGVKVGTLTSITLDPVTYEAVTEVSIDKDVLIPDDAEIKVSTDGLLGGSYLEVTAGGSPFMLEADGEFTYTQGSVSLINLLLKFGGGDDE